MRFVSVGETGADRFFVLKNFENMQLFAFFMHLIYVNCRKLQLETVPIEEIGMNLDEKYPSVEALLKRADGNYPNGGKKEGIVIRPVEPVYSERISAALSMKVVNNRYLLKNG